ncbi:MAG: diguanylate cyclase, partial [Deltaproteobacteria bacterium]
LLSTAVFLIFVALSIVVVKIMLSNRRELDRLLQFQTSILESAGEGIFGIDIQGNVTFLNSATESISGWTKDELYGSRFKGAFFSLCCEGSPCPAHQCDIAQTLQDGLTRTIPDKTFIHRDGTRFPVEFTVSAQYENQILNGAVIVFHDLSERKKHEGELLRVNRALKALSACNKALIEVAVEKELLERICRIIVENCGYRRVWIGFAENNQAKSVTPIAKWGYEDGYLESLQIVWAADNPKGRGPSGIAIRTRKPCVRNNILTDPQYEPWRNDAIKRGYASSASFPFIISEENIGTVNIYASEPDAFDESEYKLLEEMANDLAFGIKTIRSQQKIKQLAAAVEMSPDWVLVTDTNGTIEYVNKAVEEITGYTAEEMLGQNPSVVKSGRHDKQFYQEMWATILAGKTYTGMLVNRKKNGELIEIFHTITPLHDIHGNISHFVATSKDITIYRDMEQKIHTLAYYDELTGLPNRILFVDRLKQAISRAEHHSNHIGVLYIDVDRFHFINDTKGVQIGDQLLRETGKRLSGYVREGDTVARIGSDEYAVLFNDMARSEDVIFLLEEMNAALSEPVNTDNDSTTLTFSIGISMYPSDSRECDVLLQNADIACQIAKSGVGNNYRFFTQAMHESAREFISLESRLKKAIINNEFILHYQPYWDVQTKSMVGMEALIRWQSKDDGLVSPGKFIP